MKAFDKLCAVLDKIASVVTVALMIFQTFLITYSVIMRFVFNSPVAWQYETTLVCFAWIIFIGMSITFRQDEHMRLTFVTNALPVNARKYWLALMDLITFAFIVWAGYLSIGVVQNAMATMYQTIPVSRGLFYMPFPFGCAISALHIINTNVKRLTGASEN